MAVFRKDVYLIKPCEIDRDSSIYEKLQLHITDLIRKEFCQGEALSFLEKCILKESISESANESKTMGL